MRQCKGSEGSTNGTCSGQLFTGKNEQNLFALPRATPLAAPHTSSSNSTPPPLPYAFPVHPSPFSIPSPSLAAQQSSATSLVNKLVQTTGHMFEPIVDHQQAPSSSIPSSVITRASSVAAQECKLQYLQRQQQAKLLRQYSITLPAIVPARSRPADPQVCYFVAQLHKTQATELDLSKSFSGHFCNSVCESIDWSRSENILYLAHQLPCTIRTLLLCNLTSNQQHLVELLLRSVPPSIQLQVHTIHLGGTNLHYKSFKSLARFKNLRELHLSKIHPNLVRYLQKLHHLSHLKLNDLVEGTDQHVYTFLLRLAQSTRCKKSLLSLELNNNQITGSMFQVLPQFHHLETLEVNYQDVDKGAMKAHFMVPLLAMPKLKTLHLYDNGLDDDVAMVLSKHSSLCDLDIGGNFISDLGAQVLFSNSLSLQRLSLEATQVTMSSNTCASLASNRSLLYINLSDLSLLTPTSVIRQVKSDLCVMSTESLMLVVPHLRRSNSNETVMAAFKFCENEIDD